MLLEAKRMIDKNPVDSRSYNQGMQAKRKIKSWQEVKDMESMRFPSSENVCGAATVQEK